MNKRAIKKTSNPFLIQVECLVKEALNQERAEVKTANKLAADVNEIMLGYYCAGKNWALFGDQAGKVKEALKVRKEHLDEQTYMDQVGRAEAMSQEAFSWAASNGFDGKIVQVWWTAARGDLARATGVEVDSSKNPTDILLKFSDDAFLGLSAKSTKGSGDIGFKNPGIGALGQKIGLNMVDDVKNEMVKFVKKHNLPLGAAERKAFLRDPKNVNLGIAAKAQGDLILKKLRDKLMLHYLDIWEDELKKHFLQDWIDAGDNFPYYIKVTGRGANGAYAASVEDPQKSEKLKALSSGDIELEDVGSNSIGVYADGKRIMKIRFKWESQPLASTIKLSGDPW